MTKTATFKAKSYQHLDKWFKLDARNAIIKKEFIGGLSTFLAMVYILVVEPSILGNLADQNIATPGDPHYGLDYHGALFLGTAISAFIGTFLMGAFANVPIVLAPGMGLNAFFTYTIGFQFGFDFSEALVCVFFSGALYCILSITPARRHIAEALPHNFKIGIGAMIGMFIAYLGIATSGIITNHTADGSPTATPTALGDFTNPIIIISIIVLLLSFVLYFLKVQGSILITIILGIAMLGIAYACGAGHGLSSAFKIQGYNDFSLMPSAMKEMWQAIPRTLSKPLAYVAIVTVLYVDFFDTTGSLFTLGRASGLMKDGTSKEELKWLKRANLVDGFASITSSMFLSSSINATVESSAGIGVGAKTGLSSVFASFFLILTLVLWPIMGPVLPIGNDALQPVTGPILILVGALMLTQLKDFDWSKKLDIPVLMSILIFGMLGYSISAGIAWGTVAFVLVHGSYAVSQYLSPIFHHQERIMWKDTQMRLLTVAVWIILVLSLLFIVSDALIRGGVISS